MFKVIKSILAIIGGAVLAIITAQFILLAYAEKKYNEAGDKDKQTEDRQKP